MKKIFSMILLTVAGCCLLAGCSSGGEKDCDTEETATVIDEEKLKEAEALDEKGVAYLKGDCVEQDYCIAMGLFRQAAEAGSTSAVYHMGVLYMQGYGVGQNTPKAFSLFRQAADAGNAEAINTMGKMYMNGEFVERDYQKALNLFIKASDLGNADSFTCLAGLYHDGLGVEQDYRKALEMNQKGAELGDVTALNNLGYMYAHGEGVESDEQTAMEYYIDAAEKSEDGAYEELEYATSVDKELTLYIGNRQQGFQKYPVNAAGYGTVFELIAAISGLTGWNLTLCEDVCVNEDSVLINFASESSVQSGLPEHPDSKFSPMNGDALRRNILDSIQETVRQRFLQLGKDKQTCDFYYCVEFEPVEMDDGSTVATDKSWDGQN